VTRGRTADVTRTSSSSSSLPGINFSISRILDRSGLNPDTLHSQPWKLLSDNKESVENDERYRSSDVDIDRQNELYSAHDDSTSRSKVLGIHQQMAPSSFPPSWLLFGGLLVQPLQDYLLQSRRHYCSSQLAKFAIEGSYQAQLNGG
jgi:hypothetical protein